MLKNYTKKQKNINNNILILLILYTIILQVLVINPMVYRNSKVIIYMTLLFLNMSVLFKKKFKINLKYKQMLFPILIFGFLILVLSIFIDSKYLGYLIQYFTVLIIGFISLNLQFTTKNLRMLFKSYTIVSVLVGNYFVLYYGNGYSISSQYIFKSKNQVGPFLAISIIIIFWNLIRNTKLMSNSRIVDIAISLLLIFGNIVPLMVLRNRSSLIASIITMIFIVFNIYKKRRMKSVVILLISIPFIIVLLKNKIVINSLNFFIQSLTLNFDITNLESISASRWTTYVGTISFLKNNFWFGSIFNNYYLFDPHNFLLYTLYKFGVFISLPILVIYFRIGFRTLKEIFTEGNINISTYLMLFAFLMSITEYTPPFGPGTVYFLIWFLEFQNNTIWIGDR